MAAASARAQQTSDRAAFRANANVVVVPVLVTDAKGHFVSGLVPQDFEISDNGTQRLVAQLQTDRVPASLGILLDISGSMSANETRRAFELLVTRLHPEDEIFFSAFRDTVIPVVPWTRDHRRIIDGLATLTQGGNTGLYQALSAVVPMFESAAYRRKVLVIISDGLDSTYPVPSVTAIESPARVLSPLEESRARAAGVRAQENDPDLPRLKLLASIRQAINRSQTLVYAVAISSSQRVDIATLRGFTDGNGGYVESVTTRLETRAAIARICDDLQAQYVLGFEPPPRDGKVHKIAVKVRKRGLKVRARTGYIN
jgi:VWFA-related protein